MQVRLFLHNGEETTAEVLAVNEHGATLRAALRGPSSGFVTLQVDSDGKAWGSNVHVAEEDVKLIRQSNQVPSS